MSGVLNPAACVGLVQVTIWAGGSKTPPHVPMYPH